MNIPQKYVTLSTAKKVRKLVVRSHEWRFCMLRPDRDNRIEVVRANELSVLVDHMISDSDHAGKPDADAVSADQAALKRTRGACSAADVLQLELMIERPDRFMALSEAEVYAVTARNESDPVRERDLKVWTADLPFVAVLSPHTGHCVPDGNVIVIDASTDRTLLRSLAGNKIVLVFENGRPLL